MGEAAELCSAVRSGRFATGAGKKYHWAEVIVCVLVFKIIRNWATVRYVHTTKQARECTRETVRIYVLTRQGVFLPLPQIFRLSVSVPRPKLIRQLRRRGRRARQTYLLLEGGGRRSIRASRTREERREAERRNYFGGAE